MLPRTLPKPLDELPGFRRRFRVTPMVNCVKTEVEDDFHHMSVIIMHDSVKATTVDAGIMRAPWSTCPGASEKLKQTFSGISLNEFPSRGEAKTNCTHLHDLALLAAAHAAERQPLVYDILVSDAIDGQRCAELRLDNVVVLAFMEVDSKLIAPDEVAGLNLRQLGPWIATLDRAQQEAARLLRWAMMIAYGRAIPLAQQSDATKSPPNCYTFQPQRAKQAQRIGVIRDFSTGSEQPLG